MNEKYTDVEVTQVKRHRKKPRVEISLSLAKRMLRKAEVKVEPCHAYLLYASQ